jgi:multiple antibiotic resistance protein
MNDDILFLIEMYAKMFAASAPIAAMAMFISMTPGYTPKERWQLSLKATHVSFGILLLCAFFGTKLLDFMGVEMDAFRIAGGLVMGLMGLDMIRKQTDCDASSATDSKNRPDIVVTPLAFPIISGPGAISSLMITKSDAVKLTQHFYAYIALIVFMLTFYGFFYVTSYSSKWLKPSIVQISTKFCGLIVLAMAAQFIAHGILGFLK